MRDLNPYSTSSGLDWPGASVLLVMMPCAGIMQADNSEQVILDPKLIARNYMSTWFFLDLISSVPLDYIFLIFNSIRGATIEVLKIFFSFLLVTSSVTVGDDPLTDCPRIYHEPPWHTKKLLTNC